MNKLLALTLAALILLCACYQGETIDYDNSLLDYDKALAGEVEGYSYTHGIHRDGRFSYVGTSYVFDEETIQKGYIYVVTPEKSLINTSPADAVLELVFNIDYEIEETNVRIHTFSMKFEEIGCKFHNLHLSGGKTGVDIDVSSNNEVTQSLNALTITNDRGEVNDLPLELTGVLTYNGKDYDFLYRF